jgi:hypothetical protein
MLPPSLRWLLIATVLLFFLLLGGLCLVSPRKVQKWAIETSKKESLFAKLLLPFPSLYASKPFAVYIWIMGLVILAFLLKFGELMLHLR